MARTVTVRVSAAYDASFDRVFQGIERGSKRARTAVDREMKAAGDSVAKGVKGGTSAAEREMEKLRAEVEGKGSKMFSPAIEGARQLGEEAKRSFNAVARDFEMMAREADKALLKIERDSAQRKLGIGKYSSSARRAALMGQAKTIGGGVMGAGLFAYHAVNDVMRHAGYNTDLMSYVEANNELESKAIQLSNSAHISGAEGSAGQKVNPQELIKQARSVAIETASSSQDALDGLIAFTEKTGDLDTGRKILTDMAKLSKATGASMSDTVMAAGAVANQLDGVKDKGQATVEIMRAFAGQGQRGAIEIRNMATQMPKLASVASKFHVDSHTASILRDRGVTTDVGQSMAMMGAMAQAAMQTGPKASATTAINASAAFIRDVAGKTTQKNLKEAGIDIFDNSGGGPKNTMLRAPREIIKDILSKTHGDLSQLPKLLPNQNSRAIVEAYARPYIDAYKGAMHTGEKGAADKAGLAAVDAKMDEILSAAMTMQDVQDKFSAQLGSASSQAQIFDNKMAETSAAMMKDLRPAIVALAPVMLSLAQTVAQAAGLIAKWTGAKTQADKKDVQDVWSGGMSGLSALQTTTVNGREKITQEQIDFAKQKEEALKAQIDKQSVVVAQEHDERKGVGALRWSKSDEARLTERENELASLKKILEGLQNQEQTIYAKQMLDKLDIIATKIQPPKEAPKSAGTTPVSLEPHE